MKQPYKHLVKAVFFLVATLSSLPCFCWGFYAHRQVNTYATFLLPVEMLVFYKPNAAFITDHAVDPDMRRYILKEEAERHFIDMDKYGSYPFKELPRRWNEAIAKFSEDSIRAHGIVPWWIVTTQYRLTEAFKRKDAKAILKLSADLGHYIGDAHVPLHTSSNHNGQLTNQRGIHGFWESRVPELLASSKWDFFLQPAIYIKDPLNYTWNIILESAAAVDSVLLFEKKLSAEFSPDKKYAYEDRNGKLLLQYSTAFTKAYDHALGGMVERRMQKAIHTVASFWYTAWVDAGQPDLTTLADAGFSAEEMEEYKALMKNANKAGYNMHEH